MKRIFQLLSFVLSIIIFTIGNLFAQTNPSVGNVPDDSLIVNSGGGYVLIPNIDDGDGMTQAISFNITSTDNNICEPGTVDYTIGDKVAVLNLIEKGNIGTVTITVEITDADGTDQSTFTLHVGQYNKPGINFELHDIIFWQEAAPINDLPAWDTLISSGEGPWPYINWSYVTPMLTVDDQCTGGPCSGSDFMTALYKGYVIPPTTGQYTFIIESNNNQALWLSTDDDFSNAQAICYEGSSSIGTIIGNECHSAIQNLVAGQVYAVYATQWIVHLKSGGIQWTGPGISREYIPGEYLMHTYDPVAPTSPTNLTLSTKGTNMLRVSWDEGTDNKAVSGYFVYVDGFKVNIDPINDPIYQIDGLSANTKYSIVVTTADEMGNESDPGNIITTTTWPTDGINPTPPNTINTITNTGTALEIGWSGATDGETEVIGYNLYVDGILYNTDDYIYETSTIIKVLNPHTSYNITIEAIDAALNVSVLSSTHTETTANFDPFGDNLGVKRAIVNVEMENIAFSTGIGINPSWENGNAINDVDQMNLLKDMKAGAIRWGGIGANNNSHSFSNHIGTSPTLTYGDWIDAAIELDAYAVISCAVQDGSDFRTSINTFTYFLEYINGTAGTTYGDMRIAEGYTQPMLQNVKGLIFEFGSEVWGGSSHYAEIGNNYDEYALWCRQAADMIKASPYYDEDRIKLVYSGRGPSAAHTQNQKVIDGDDGKVDWLAISGYLGGNLSYDPEIDPGETELDYYKNGIEMMSENFLGTLDLMKLSLEKTGRIMPMYFYEGNTTTPAYNARLGQGIITLDYFAGAIERGHVVPSLFHLIGNQWRITDPNNGYEPYCLYYTAKFFNKVAKDRNIIKTTVQSPDKITNSIGTILDFDPVGAYAYTIDGDYSVVLISRDYSEDYYVQLDLPDAVTFSGTATQYLITGTDISAFETSVDSTTITLTDSLLIKVPKHSMLILSFTGEDQNFTSMKPGEYTYVKQSSISIELDGGATELTEDGGSLLMNAVTLPANSFITAVKWEVIHDTINILHAAAGEGYIIQGSGSCDGNGTVTIRATALDDTLIYDEIVIPVSGQEDPGGCIERHSVIFTVDDGTTPISGASIIFNSQTQITDGSGQTIFTDVEIGNNLPYSITAGGFDAGSGTIDVIDQDVYDTIHLNETVYSVTFIVDDGGTPISGASVTFNSQTQSTNASGQSVFTNISIGNNLPYSITATGFIAGLGTLNVVDQNVIETVHLDSILSGTYFVTFTVDDGTTPISGASVTFNSQTLITNGSGQVVFGNVFPASDIPYNITATGFDAGSGTLNVVDQDVSEEVHLNETVYSVTFTVDDGTTPISGASVIFNSQTQTTNASGQTVFTNVSIGNNLSYNVSATGYTSDIGTLNVTDSDINKAIQLDLIIPGTYTVTYTVQEGTDPLADVYVDFNSEIKKTGIDGVVTFYNVANGTNLNYSAEISGYITSTGSIDVNNADVNSVIIMWPIPTYSVTFTVDDGATPISGASVTFNSLTQTTNILGQTIFTNVSIGNSLPYSITAGGFDVGSGTLNVVDQDVNEAVQLNEIVYSVTFTVDDGITPISGAQVTFNSLTRVTDGSGQTIFTNVSIGNNLAYSITAGGFDVGSGTLDVVDQNVNEEVHLNETVYSVTFTVDDGTIPIPDASVTFNSLTRVTDGSGQTVFTNVSIGNSLPYSITAGGFEVGSGTLNVVDQNINEVVHLNETGYSVTFTVLEGQNPIAGVYVNFNSVILQTGADGIVEFNNVTPGTGLVYSAEISGFQISTGSVDVNSADVFTSIFMWPNSINELVLGQIIVYPNPVKDILTIDNIPDLCNISVVSITGQKLIAFDKTAADKLEIDLGNLENGIYFLDIQMKDNITLCKKVVKY